MFRLPEPGSAGGRRAFIIFRARVRGYP